MPKDESRNAWETRTHEFFNSKSKTRVTSVSHTLSKPEARIAILGDGGLLRVEASLPKLLYGNNLSTVCDPLPAMERLREFVSAHVTGNVRRIDEMDCLRVDFCHNFSVGPALPDYVNTLSRVQYLKHRRTYDGNGGVEWLGTNGRMVRAYDKHREILEKDEKDIPEAMGILRFEVQIRKKSQYLQRRLGTRYLKMLDVLEPALAYRCLVETLSTVTMGAWR